MIQVIDCDQGTPEWFAARAGIPTASEFSTIMASGRGGSDSKTRRTYMLKLAGERLSGEPMQSYSNGHMERGKEMEAEARAYYAFLHDAEPQQIGFIRNGDKGCSPDALLGNAGLLEIKTALPHILLDHILKDEFPPEHKAQTQGQLWVAERDWVDLIVYWPKLPTFIKRVYHDKEYISKIAAAVDRFNEDLNEIVTRLGGNIEIPEAIKAAFGKKPSATEAGANSVTRYALVLMSQNDRHNAIKYIESAPWGTRVELKSSRRSIPQNSLMWSLLSDIAEQVKWCEMRLRPDDWKILFLSALKQELRLVPNLNGDGVVQLGRSSSDLSKSEMTELIEFIIAWGAGKEVKFKLLPEIESAL